MEPTIRNTANRSIAIKRLLLHSVDMVWDAWTSADNIAQWWGPNGFTNTIHTMEFRAGGEWRLTMHGPDGKRYSNKSNFLEIVPMQKIVFQHYNPNYLATVIFTPEKNTTLLDWEMLFETAELFDTVVKVFKADEGLQQNVEKLDRFLIERLQWNPSES